jgi:hypothetical protein
MGLAMINDRQINKLMPCKESLESLNDLLIHLEAYFRSIAKAVPIPEFKELMANLAGGVEATRHDASLQWLVDQLKRIEEHGFED